jgi:polysaccharide deacetylase 2 family uncharacterized protein YibQ
MSKRRSTFRSATQRRAGLLAAVVVVGLLTGVALSQGWRPRRAVQPLRPPAGLVPGASEAFDDTAIDAAVRAALEQTATIVKVGETSRTARQRGQAFQWTTHTLDVKARARITDLTRLLQRQVVPTGGLILEQTPTVLRIGLRRAGVDLVTHEIQLIPYVPTARVAILFDDAGGSLQQLDPIFALSRPVTVTVLPGLRFSREVALRAQEAGLDVLLHLPLEPEDARNPLGPGGVLTTMSDAQIAQVVADDLDSVPGAIGANNHEGSRATADERVMRVVLGALKSRGLFFVDSVTSPRSVGARLAAEMQIPTASRAIFLDNQNQAEAIRTQLRRLITLARGGKDIVAIGHANRLTPQVLKEILPEFDREDIALVTVSALVK